MITQSSLIISSMTGLGVLRVGQIPDYRKPVEQVYAKFAVKCMKDSASLNVLATVEDRSERQKGNLPTWVPDFSVSVERN